MGGEPEAKRRKLPPLRRPASLPVTKSHTASPLPNRSTNNSVGNVGQISILEAKNEAVKQAQQEGSIKSFKVFDSPFGNFLLPVIPSLSELT